MDNDPIKARLYKEWCTEMVRTNFSQFDTTAITGGIMDIQKRNMLSSLACDHIDKSLRSRYVAHIEQQIAVCIRPKPRWMSRSLWNRIVRRVVYIEMTKPLVTWGKSHGR